MLGLRKEICEGHLGGSVHAVLPSWGKLLPSIARGLLGEETWSLCAHNLPSPRRCPFAMKFLTPSELSG